MAVTVLVDELVTRRGTPWATEPDAPRGYLAGEQDPTGDPGDGLVTSGGAAAARWVYVFVEYGFMLGPVVAAVFSSPTGTWRVDDLPSTDRYTVMAIDYTGTYQLVGRQNKQPYTP